MIELDLEDKIVNRWLSGQHIRGISRSLEMPPRAVRDVIEKWSSEIVPIDKNIQVAKQLGRLDRLLAVVLPLAASGNLKAVAAAGKLITAQCLITGICQPNSAQANNNMFVQVNQLERRQDSTSRIEEALNRLIADQRRERDQQRAEVIEAETNPVKTDAAEVTE